MNKLFYDCDKRNISKWDLLKDSGNYLAFSNNIWVPIELTSFVKDCLILEYL